jgi:hypothetical protein
MKKVIFGLLSLVSIAFVSCEKQADSPAVNPDATAIETTEMAPSFVDQSARQNASVVITASQLNGKYELRYANTSEDRTWKVQRSVGLSFLPDTFYYTTTTLDFNAATAKVGLSAKSTIAGTPDSSYGSLAFALAGESLKITVSDKPDNSGDYKVNYLSKKWLILEDVRTKIAWAFIKK